ncbi:hypothetical protein K431DRAFT_288644 [Polychaeton citri CBS 116435]|uniref:COP9 signalosome complex subunit 6 n=1 Tax=Polychaeton citri CBS 116435 TaxID=1314669 RepID=A0A9P4ULV6_9PEZI|nr:hypothetical protein K431DRAFT_288644 [Polychaeton citri CBS 116435]
MARDQDSPSNPLVSTGRALDTSLNVQLHPLVLLTISDYITRHTLRHQQGPVIGAVIGSQHGRDYTLEHAYECKLAAQQNNPDGVVLDRAFFETRLEQYREVHKAPQQLDLMGMFMIGPQSGPQPSHLPVLQQVREITNTDNILLLLFHPESDIVNHLQGGKLPITLYESFQEPLGDSGNTQMRFRELSFEVETGEAEMIGVDFVAKGGGNATAIPSSSNGDDRGTSSKEANAESKGKAKEEEKQEAEDVPLSSALSPEDEELISTLTAKTNAIKMLNQRIDLIRTYLTSLPESYLVDANSKTSPPDATNHALLRSISALLSRLPLLAPPTSDVIAPEAGSSQLSSLETAATKEREDVHLTSLLASLTRSISEIQTMGERFHIVQREKRTKENTAFRGPPGRGMGFGDNSALLAGDGGL